MSMPAVKLYKNHSKCHEGHFDARMTSILVIGGYRRKREKIINFWGMFQKKKNIEKKGVLRHIALI